MLPLNLGKIAQEFPRRSVGGPFKRTLIEPQRFCLHDFDLFAHRLNSERPDKPNGPAFEKSFHVLAADEWDVLTKALAKNID